MTADRTPIRVASPPTIDVLTGVRALAAWWVVLYHLRPLIFTGLPALVCLRPIADQGYLGVDLFFVLSGFILSYNYLDRLAGGLDGREWRSFLRLRLARIWPVHVFTLHIAAVVAFRDLPGVDYSWAAYVENLTLTQAWFGERLSWNIPAWTISAEWATYVVFPVLALGLQRVTTQRLAWLGVGAAYGSWTLVVLTCLWDLPPAMGGSILRAGTQFAAGCFLFLIYRRRPTPPRAPIAAIAVLGLVGALWGNDWRDKHAMLLAPIFGLVVLGLARGDRVLDRLLKAKRVVFWGEVSYSLYLTHQLVEHVLNKVHPVAAWRHDALPWRSVIVAGHIALIGVVAVTTYRFVERPSRRLLAGRGRSRDLAAVEPTPAGS